MSDTERDVRAWSDEELAKAVSLDRDLGNVEMRQEIARRLRQGADRESHPHDVTAESHADSVSEEEPPYCLDCGHPPVYHQHGHCAATMVAEDGEEYPCGCESDQHFLGRDADRPAPEEEPECYACGRPESDHPWKVDSPGWRQACPGFYDADRPAPEEPDRGEPSGDVDDVRQMSDEELVEPLASLARQMCDEVGLALMPVKLHELEILRRLRSTGEGAERCEKCGSDDVNTRYEEAVEFPHHRRHYRCRETKDEHLHRTCRNCGYEWCDPVRAAPPEGEEVGDE